VNDAERIAEIRGLGSYESALLSRDDLFKRVDELCGIATRALKRVTKLEAENVSLRKRLAEWEQRALSYAEILNTRNTK